MFYGWDISCSVWLVDIGSSFYTGVVFLYSIFLYVSKVKRLIGLLILMFFVGINTGISSTIADLSQDSEVYADNYKVVSADALIVESLNTGASIFCLSNVVTKNEYKSTLIIQATDIYLRSFAHIDPGLDRRFEKLHNNIKSIFNRNARDSLRPPE